MSEYSRGPWAFVQVGDANAVVHIEEGCTVGGIYRGGDTDLLSPANARLIAAAPMLVEALQDALGWLNSSEVQYVISHKLGEQAALQRTLKKAREVILGVEGRGRAKAESSVGESVSGGANGA